MGRLWLFDETINTDVLAPGFYMKSPLAELSKHCLEAVRPEFASKVQKGDVVLAGENMGVGSSREQAAEVLKFLGISCIIATSFAGIFYRNAINLGLPAFLLPKDSQFGFSYNHLSNASLGSKNPGANSYMFNFLKKF